MYEIISSLDLEASTVATILFALHSVAGEGRCLPDAARQ